MDEDNKFAGRRRWLLNVVGAKMLRNTHREDLVRLPPLVSWRSRRVPLILSPRSIRRSESATGMNRTRGAAAASASFTQGKATAPSWKGRSVPMGGACSGRLPPLVMLLRRIAPLHPVFRPREERTEGRTVLPCGFVELEEAIIEIGHDGRGFSVTEVLSLGTHGVFGRQA